MMPICARIALLVVVLIASAMGCQVPVFRFALERWDADNYRVVVFEKGPSDATAKKLIERLQNASRLTESGESSAGHANFTIERANIDHLTDAQQWSLLGWEDIDSFPAMQIYYPESTGIESPLWQGNITDANIDALLASPVRKELVRRITSGDSAVWVLTESADVVANARAEENLITYLKSAEAQLDIPEGVIRPEELESAINTRDIPVEMDDVLRSRIPLKIAFSVLRLNPQDPAEAIFSRMLTQGDSPKTSPSLPTAIAVFGRGRMMPGIPAERITEKSILGAATYLCGACSCQVKEQNPGLDLLVVADWSEHLQDGLIVTERELPPLSGAGDLASPAATAVPNATEVTAPSTSSTPNTLLVSLAAVVAAVGLASLVLLRRSTNA